MLKQYFFHIMLKKIERSDDDEIMQIIQAVQRRYEVLFPDWEVSFLSLPIEPVERKRQLDLFCDFILKHNPGEHTKNQR